MNITVSHKKNLQNHHKTMQIRTNKQTMGLHQSFILYLTHKVKYVCLILCSLCMVTFLADLNQICVLQPKDGRVHGV